MHYQRHNEHQYAFDANGEWVNAFKTEFKEYQTFFCSCPQRHKMKLVKPSGTLGKRAFTDYFAHVVPPSSSNSSKRQKTTEPVCSSGGESVIHMQAKHRLRERVGSYFFATFHCKECHIEVLHYTHDCSVSMEVVSDDKKWRYDCLLLSKEGSPLVAMEVVHKHATGEDKIQSVRESGLEIVEFRAKDVLEMPSPATEQGLIKLENIKLKYGKCPRCASFLTISELSQVEKAMLY
jgi:hypothetical protein